MLTTAKIFLVCVIKKLKKKNFVLKEGTLHRPTASYFN